MPARVALCRANGRSLVHAHSPIARATLAEQILSWALQRCPLVRILRVHHSKRNSRRPLDRQSQSGLSRPREMGDSDDGNAHSRPDGLSCPCRCPGERECPTSPRPRRHPMPCGADVEFIHPVLFRVAVRVHPLSLSLTRRYADMLRIRLARTCTDLASR